jgi:hypothetical protein
MQHWFANYKISFYHLLKSCDCREDNQMTPSKPKPQETLCYSGVASPGPLYCELLWVQEELLEKKKGRDNGHSAHKRGREALTGG